MPRTSLKQATAALTAQDRVIARLADVAGPCRLPARQGQTHFAALVRAIVYQQLQGKAASAIHGRLVETLRGDVTPRAVLRRRAATLRRAGLSAAKEASIRDLASKVEGGAVELDRLPRLRDHTVVEQLVQVRGIGPWTAEMFLISQLRRLDVWPVLDYGVRRGYGLAWGLAEMPTSRELQQLGERFRPYRTIAAWYCWRAADMDDLSEVTAAGRTAHEGRRRQA